jgi:hypothetical protein
MVLLVAVGIERIRPIKIQILVLAIVVALGVSNVVSYYHKLTIHKYNWPAVITYLSGHATAGEPVLVYRGFSMVVLDYYLSTKPSRLKFLPLGEAAQVDDSALRGHSDVWLVLCHCRNTAKTRSLESLLTSRYTPTAEVDFPGIRIVRFASVGPAVPLSGCPDPPWD